MRSSVHVRNARRILCVFPRYAASFGTLQYAYRLMDGVRAFMPPQGLLVVAAYLPETWEVRLVDENIRPASAADFAWADAVLVSGMHVQREVIIEIARRARAFGKPSVLGGPSVSSCPERYPEFDYLHLGELGDATDALISALDADASRPAEQRVFTTNERLPLSDFPLPAYKLIEGPRYLVGSVQFSSGCPYQCEFCDIPSLYGRQPRYKRPERVIAELEAMLAAGISGCVYFVDDNFIANKKATRELLPHLVAWQKANGYPLQLAGEATLNIAACSDILAMMRDAHFVQMFCGIETPELDALDAMKKSHNHQRLPILDAIRTINSFGIEVSSGIIIGLDTDTAATAAAVMDFVECAQTPFLSINLLYALPRTPLWDRLAAAERLDDRNDRVSNVIFLRPHDQVLADWHQIVRRVYAPEALYRRFAWNAEPTYPNRVRPPLSRARLKRANLRRGLIALTKIITLIGLFGDYRRSFWRVALPALRKGRIGELITMGFIAHHLINFARDCTRQTAAFYAHRPRVEVAKQAA